MAGLCECGNEPPGSLKARGLQPCCRILLYGPPGTGKTELANALAVELKIPFYSVTSTDLLSSWVGQSEKLVRELFDYTRKKGEPCIIFVDEVDSLCRKRTSAEREMDRRIKTELLVQMDRCDSCSFLLCATNYPWDIDSAFMRRFQMQFYIPLPDRDERLQIMRLHTAENSVELSDTDWQQLLDHTEGFSGCDLRNLTRMALMRPLHDLCTATHWLPVCTGVLIPCSDDCLGAVQTRLEDIPPAMVTARSVTFADFQAALCSVHRTVSADEVAKFEHFIG
ncbi:uncharacterized protein [Periplaneta americana]|uniref:uncharacterized protein n=1 Tax=Periplaneta americana TaxID=6978 RepID=UPI0037E8CD7D